jgi:acyl-CoA dehydrogenase
MELREKLNLFMDEFIYPNERTYKDEVDRNGREKGNRWIPTKIVEELKPIARSRGLWNLFLPKSPRAPEGLSILDFAPLCEIMGRITWAPV